MTPEDRAALVALKDAVVVGDDAAFRRANRAVFSTPCQDITLQLREGRALHAYKGSTDAALALLGAVLPETEYRLHHFPGKKVTATLWGTHKGRDGMRWHDFKDGSWNADAPTPARALLLATLSALIEQEARDG